MSDRRIRSVTAAPYYQHECDAPRCRRMGRWAVALDPGYRLYLCEQHRDETVANYAKAAS